MVFLSNRSPLRSGGAETHIDLIKKVQSSLKSSQKTVQKLSKELATKVAEELNSNPNPADFFSLHRNDGVDIDFANTFLRTVKVTKPIFYFITIADGIDSKSGSLIIQGTPEDIGAVADEICTLLGGKGNGKNNRYQAKVTQLNKIKDCEVLLKKHFENK
jgi:misacylated tRNA(Ala) deacylase